MKNESLGIKGKTKTTRKILSIKAREKVSRTEMVSVRLSPELRYLAELAARQQRRTLSSFIEWVIEQQISTEEICEGSSMLNRISLSEIASDIWKTNEVDRFCILATKFPLLLTYDEQVLWKTIENCSWLWGLSDSESTTLTARTHILQTDRLKQIWPQIKKVAAGTLNISDISFTQPKS